MRRSGTKNLASGEAALPPRELWPHGHFPHNYRPHVHVPHAHFPHGHNPHIHVPKEFVESSLESAKEYGEKGLNAVSDLSGLFLPTARVSDCSVSKCEICVHAPVVADPETCVDPITTLRHAWEQAVMLLKLAVNNAAKSVESLFDSALRLLNTILDTVRSLFGEVAKMATEIFELTGALQNLVADIATGAFGGITSIKDSVMNINSFVRGMLPEPNAVTRAISVGAASAFAAKNSCIDVSKCLGITEDPYVLHSHDYDLDGSPENTASSLSTR